MQKLLIEEFFKNSSMAYSLFKIILNKNESPNDYEVIDVNKQFEEITGLKGCEVIGKTIKEICLQYDEMAQEWIKAIGDSSFNKKTFEWKICDELKEKYIKVIIFYVDKYNFGAIYEDVTKEYLAKKQVEFFIESNIDLLCVTDTRGKAIKVNKEFQNVLGYEAGQLNISLIHKDDVEETLKAIKEINEKKTRVTFINRYSCKYGGYRNIEWCGILHGKYIYISGRDITEKIKMEEKIKNINSDLMKLTEELKEKNEILKHIANTDELTSLYNRYFFKQIIKDKIEYADTHNEIMSLIIFDLDYFKQVNDNWGHPVGDEVLKTTALIAKDAIRNTDFLVRWGGEEFIILMPKTNLNDAVFVVERIRKKIQENIYEEVEHLTCSFGVAERLKNESFKKWYKKADEALYSAKCNGRNCIVTSDDEKNKSIVSLNFLWSTGWESGNKIIDEQHYELSEIANKLMNMSLSNGESKKLIEELQIFILKLKKHFDYEEEVLNKTEYPQIDEHAKLHKEAIGKLVQLKEYSECGNLKHEELFKIIINDIVREHMIQQDTLFFPYIKNQT